MSAPLSGVLVVDLSRALAGPHAAMMLGDLGARVIKVENPGTGDESRQWGPPFVGPQDDPVSTHFLSANRNKESVQLDLTSDTGRRDLERLVERADVLVENFRPGSLLAAIVGVHAFRGTRWTVAGEVPRALGNQHPTTVPYGAFATRDGTIQIAVGNDQWRAVALTTGLDAADPRFATARSRVRHRTELTAALEDRLGTRCSADWLTRFAEAGVPSGSVCTLDEGYTWDQTLSQGLVVDVDHLTLGPIRLPGPPLRMGGLDGTETPRTHTAPPALGQHDTTVRAWLDAG